MAGIPPGFGEMSAAASFAVGHELTVRRTFCVAAPKVRVARAETPPLVDHRPNTPSRPERLRPRRPYDPPISYPAPPVYYPEAEPYYPRRPRPFPTGPFYPPVVHGEPPYHPRFPRPTGPNFPRGPYGEGSSSPPIMRDPGSYPRFFR
jgi:hypothetical protein